MNSGDLMSEVSKTASQEQVFRFAEHFAGILYILFMFTTFFCFNILSNKSSVVSLFTCIPHHISTNLKMGDNIPQSLSCINLILFPMFVLSFLLFQIFKLVIAEAKIQQRRYQLGKASISSVFIEKISIGAEVR